MTDANGGDGCTIIGIGNVLMGDEGVGVHVARLLETRDLPPGTTCLDGGTGGLHLLGPFRAARRLILIDATVDGAPEGTVRRLEPRYSRDYPRTLTAHDIGLKDVLDAMHLLGDVPDVTLFTVSIRLPEGLGMDLSDPIATIVPDVAARVLDEARR